MSIPSRGRIDGTPEPELMPRPKAATALAQRPTDLDLDDPAVADRLVAALWACGWLPRSRNAGVAASVPAEG